MFDRIKRVWRRLRGAAVIYPPLPELPGVGKVTVDRSGSTCADWPNVTGPEPVASVLVPPGESGRRFVELLRLGSTRPGGMRITWHPSGTPYDHGPSGQDGLVVVAGDRPGYLARVDVIRVAETWTYCADTAHLLLRPHP